MSTFIPEPEDILFEQKSQFSPKILLMVGIVSLLAIIAGLVFIPISNRNNFAPGARFPVTSENVVVNRVNVVSAQGISEKVPVGFPPGIPMEATIDESYSVVYTERSLIQYTVSYASSQKIVTKYKEYLSYMNFAGYEIKTSKNQSDGALIYGTKDGDDLSVDIREKLDRSEVHITYVDRY